MLDTPHTPLNSPCTRARSSNVNMSPIMMIANGNSPAAPSPCSARKRINQCIVGATAHNKLANRNNPIDHAYTIRRPNMSLSFPVTGIPALDAKT